MKSFLNKIASQYILHEANNLHKYCFVFPNTRAGLFFQKALKEEVLEQPIIAPECIGINDIFYRMSSREPLDQIGLLCYLFKEYKKMVPEAQFDNFVNLGKTILHDFDEIDKYIANAQQVFTNVADLQEIDLIFDSLSEQQKQIILDFWGHVNYTDVRGSHEMHEKFKSLWDILYTLYTQFKEALSTDNKAYDGQLFREVIENLDASKKLPYQRYIFIGFNALNPTEKALLLYFQTIDKADFYFDYDSSWIRDQKESAGKFMQENNNFKSLYTILEDKTSILNVPKFECISVPSNVGQTKVVNQKLEQIFPNDEAEKTAIILPDEALLIPLLHSIPNSIPAINITMGYPLNNTPIAALMEFIVTLQLEKRGENFYHKHVSNILNHPYIASINPKSIHQLKEAILNEKKFELSTQEIIETCCDPLFKVIFTSIDTINSYLRNILLELEPILRNQKNSILEQEFYAHYLNAIELLDQHLEHHSIDISNSLYFSLLKQITIGKKVPFHGEPISGLQIMGMLESRNLDFDEIIMPSFNDEFIPRTQTNQSIIPYNLRCGFGLPTYENYDAIYAYNFYRLLQRSKRITFIYNSDSNNGSEISRYFLQLFHLHKTKLVGNPPADLSSDLQKKWMLDAVEKCLNHHTIDYTIKSKKVSLEIQKTDCIQEQLKEYINNKEKHLSPSDIKTYISCPMQFYLKKIAGLQTKNELEDSIQANVFGSIYHRIMMEIYEPHIGREILPEHLKISETQLNNLLTKAFNIEYYGLSEEEANNVKKLKEIKGYNAIIADVIKTLVKNTLTAEVRFTPFTYIKGELRLTNIPIHISNNKTLYLKGFIDRIDQDQNGNVRIIDYKTGSDKETFKLPISNLFEEKNIHEFGAIVQTYLYCYMYGITQSKKNLYLPQIYQVKQCTSPSFDPAIKYTPESKGKTENLSFSMENMNIENSLEYEFMQHIKSILTQIFDSKEAFKQTSVHENCTYCDFKAICNR